MVNEPMVRCDVATLYLVQNRLYHAIREVDARHVVIFEDGYTGLDYMPTPAIAGWNNVMLSCHHYHFHAALRMIRPPLRGAISTTCSATKRSSMHRSTWVNSTRNRTVGADHWCVRSRPERPQLVVVVVDVQDHVRPRHVQCLGDLSQPPACQATRSLSRQPAGMDRQVPAVADR